MSYLSYCPGVLRQGRAGGGVQKQMAVYDTLQNKTVTPSKSVQRITGDSQYNGLGTVTVNATTASVDSNIQASNIKNGDIGLFFSGTIFGSLL